MGLLALTVTALRGAATRRGRSRRWPRIVEWPRERQDAMCSPARLSRRLGHDDPQHEVGEEAAERDRAHRADRVEDPHDRRTPAQPLRDAPADAPDHLVLPRALERHGAE